MRLLLDSNVLIWWFAAAHLLSKRADSVVRAPESQLHISAASVWEIAIKHAAGKFDAGRMLEQVPIWLEAEQFIELPVSSAHAKRAASLPLHYKDPFDRMLAAQAQAENLAIISNDRVFDFYGISRIW